MTARRWSWLGSSAGSHGCVTSLPVAVMRSKHRAALDKIGKWTLEIIKRSDAAKGYKLLPRRWVVKLTFAWLNRNRRLAKDFENSIESATA